MTGLRVTKQQFLDKMLKLGYVQSPAESMLDDMLIAGFVLIDKQALQKRLECAVKAEKGWLGARKHRIDKEIASEWHGEIMVLNKLLEESKP